MLVIQGLSVELSVDLSTGRDKPVVNVRFVDEETTSIS